MVKLTGDVCFDCCGRECLRHPGADAVPGPCPLQGQCRDEPNRVKRCAVRPPGAHKARASQPTAWLSRPACARSCGAPAAKPPAPVCCTVVRACGAASSILSAALPAPGALRLLFCLRCAPAYPAAPAAVAVPPLPPGPFPLASAALRPKVRPGASSRARHPPGHGRARQGQYQARMVAPSVRPAGRGTRSENQPGINRSCQQRRATSTIAVLFRFYHIFAETSIYGKSAFYGGCCGYAQ
jgi:hypothetical protein